MEKPDKLFLEVEDYIHQLHLARGQTNDCPVNIICKKENVQCSEIKEDCMIFKLIVSDLLKKAF